MATGENRGFILSTAFASLNTKQSRLVLYLLSIAVIGIIMVVGSNLTERKQTESTGYSGDAAVAGDGSMPATATVTVEESGVTIWGDYSSNLEKELTAALIQVAGVGNVKVVVTLAGSARREFAYNRTNRQSDTTETDAKGGQREVHEIQTTEDLIMVRTDPAKGGEQPVLVFESLPPVSGVMVIAEGAKDNRIKLLIAEAVSDLLGIPIHKVTVLPKR